MRFLKYAVLAFAMLASAPAIAVTVKTSHIQAAYGLATEVFLPHGVHINIVNSGSAYDHVMRVHSGNAATYQSGISFIPKNNYINGDIIINASNGDVYVIWTRNINHVPKNVVYSIP